jgi:hypothetical protein
MKIRGLTISGDSENESHSEFEHPASIYSGLSAIFFYQYRWGNVVSDFTWLEMAVQRLTRSAVVIEVTSAGSNLRSKDLYKPCSLYSTFLLEDERYRVSVGYRGWDMGSQISCTI